MKLAKWSVQGLASLCLLACSLRCSGGDKAGSDSTATDIPKVLNTKTEFASGGDSRLKLLDVSKTVGLDFVYRNGEDQTNRQYSNHWAVV